MPQTELAADAVPDVGAFLARLVRRDPEALLRLRPVRAGAVALWGRLPFDVLVTRLVRSDLAEDATVNAAELLRGLERGERSLRDELLDHVALVVTHGDHRAEVPVRLVQALARMDFLGADDAAPVRIRRAPGWLGTEGRYGAAWYRTGDALRLSPRRT